MDTKEKEEKMRESFGAQTALVLLSIERVNHKPHPYTIGPKHVAWASEHSGGSLTEETFKKVPCAARGCQLSYAEHTSDEAAFVQLTRNATGDEIRTILKRSTEKLGDKFVDGFVFVETKEKFRVTKE
jgi:hypothetical protein